MKRIVALLMVLLLLLCGCKNEKASQKQEKTQINPTTAETTDQFQTQPPTQIPTEEQTVNVEQDPALSRELDAIINNHHYEGVASVYYKGKKVYESATGYADKDVNRKNSPQDIFRIASLTKQFTATGICLLYEQGKLSVYDTVSKYFPYVAYGDMVTIENLLNMTSGIPDFASNRYEGSSLFEISQYNTADANKQILENWILSCNLSFTPGTMWDYSNSNYFLLGRIIEIASGQKYEDFINDKIINPLKLKSTGFDLNSVTTNGYVYDSAKSELALLSETGTQWLIYPGVMFASGDMCSRVDDLYVWITALRDGKIVKPQTFSVMTQNNSISYGYGFFVNDVACYHTGHVGSYLSYLGLAREKDFVVITLSNTYSDSEVHSGIGVLLGNAALEYLES